MAQSIKLPDGSFFPLKAGEDPREAMAEASRMYPEAFGRKKEENKPKEDTKGFKAAAAAGFERLKGESALTAAKLGLMDVEEAEKFQALSVSKALREIGKLEARFEKQEAAEETAVRSKPVVQKSKAPAPLSPLKATGSAMESLIGSDNEFHGSFQAWKAARKAGKIR
jgi:hypothetical protein